MSQSTAMSVFKDFFPPEIITFVSDRSVDFVLKDDQTDLTRPQKKFFSKNTGLTLSSIVNVRQVHGNNVIVVKARPRIKELLENADGIITNVPNLPIAIRTADCLPIFLCDPKNQVIGVVHAGWRGIKKGIIAQALKAMKKDFHSRYQDVRVAIGPAIKSCCYRVGAEFNSHFPEETLKKDKGYYLDLVAVARKQLFDLGVFPRNVYDSTICTSCDKDYFSYRREGDAAGRMISLMMIRP